VHGLDRLAVGQPLHELQYQHGKQLHRLQRRPPEPGMIGRHQSRSVLHQQRKDRLGEEHKELRAFLHRLRHARSRRETGEQGRVRAVISQGGQIHLAKRSGKMGVAII